jgi:hypothetical protein
MIIQHGVLDLYCDCCPIGRDLPDRTTERIMERTFENAKTLACRHGWSFKKDLCRCKTCGSENNGNGRDWPERIEQ